MNNQVKILLTIQGIAGRTLRPLGKKKVKWTISKKEIDSSYNKKDANKVVDKGTSYITDYEVVPAQQTIKLTYDAYNNFISDECPSWYTNKKNPWRVLKPNIRLELHLQRICEDRRGTSFIYSILED